MGSPDSLPSGGWRFAADRGGTFTDLIGIDPAGSLHTRKLLSVSPAYPDAVAAGVRDLLGLAPGDQVPAGQVASLRIGTTVATNALLEGRGARVGLVLTRGFGDLLEIGHQARPHLFELAIRKPRQLYQRVVEVAGRLDANGAQLEALDETGATQALAGLRAQGVEAVSIVLLHAWRNPTHELRLGELAHAAGFTQVSLSHGCGGRIRVVERAQTCVLDAYLSPVLATYLGLLSAQLGPLPVEFMQSGGGLAPAALCSGKDAVLSGPAGGVVAVASLAGQTGHLPLIGFDMGGTSTDVCRYDGQFDYTAQIEAAGVHFQSHALRIQTVAAGGGSILGFDGQRLTVGPASAGADPGPTCYGRGGPLTLTDANLLLGRLPEHAFSPNTSTAGASGLDLAATRAAFAALAARVSAATDTQTDPETLALGYLQVANEQMAAPIKTLSVGRGFDLREHTLCSYGGAGGLHACAMARDLGIERVVIHPLAGLFSAWGIALADRLEQAERSVLLPLDTGTLAGLEPLWQTLYADTATRLGAASDRVERELDLRPPGGDSVLTVTFDDLPAMTRAYRAAHGQRFGYAPGGDALEVVTVRLRLRRGSGLTATPAIPESAPAS
ncbi:MAG: hydantoinase/oxoprolinase family protein, partial [Immundisolibacter sp.]|uniref:hydantoinase/oxoprolinase family protein n=1 Tax=Immundisolibacter sp. TaxID=1934948 RepID=UPI003EE03A38